MKIKYLHLILIGCLLACLGGGLLNQAYAVDNTNPTLAEGDYFFTRIETGNGVMFQHTDKNGAVCNFMAFEVINGTWDGSDCRLYTSRRGGSYYFLSNQTATIQAYSSGIASFNVEGAQYTKLTNTSWTIEITPGQTVQISWGYPFTLPHEENFMFYLGLVGVIFLICGILLSAYAFRHYKIFTLGNEETIWDKDILPFCIILLIGGVCLIVAWLFS